MTALCIITDAKGVFFYHNTKVALGKKCGTPWCKCDTRNVINYSKTDDVKTMTIRERKYKYMHTLRYLDSG